MSKKVSADTTDLFAFLAAGFAVSSLARGSFDFAVHGDWWTSAVMAVVALLILAVMIFSTWVLSEKAKRDAGIQDILVEYSRSEAVSVARHEAEIAARQSIRADVLKAIDGDVSGPHA